MSKSLNTFTEDFFNTHQKFLQETYPGLTVRRVKQELELLLMTDKGSSDSLHSVYLPHTENPATRFFNNLELGIPLEYITGRAYFYRSEFKVSPDVLIPRSETEMLVELTVNELKKWSKRTKEVLKFVDVGTGTGIIPISILQEITTPAKGLATDISYEALSIARQNAFNLRFTWSSKNELDFVQTDRLEGVDENFHVIVSNPPYIKREMDKALVHDQVKQFEPDLALWLDDTDYESWFEAFFSQVFNRLLKGGVFLMEGHENHLDNLSKIGEKCGFENTEVLKDLTGRKRFLIMRKNHG